MTIGGTLGLTAVGFKVAYTNAEAPELLNAVPPSVLGALANITLLAQARMVFLGILLALTYGLVLEWQSSRGCSRVPNSESFPGAHISSDANIHSKKSPR